MEQNYRLLLAVGNQEIEEQIRAIPGVNVVDQETDIEIITDVLNYDETIDFVIVNTVLSEEKSLALARKAKEKTVKVIALLESYQNEELIASLVGSGVKGFAPFDELYRIGDLIRAYPETFDFSKIHDPPKTRVEDFTLSRSNANLKGKIFVAIFNICSGAGATSTVVELAENLANSGQKTVCISLDGSGDFGYINRKKCKAEYVEIRRDGIVAALDQVYSGMEYTFILFDFGKIYDIDSAGNLISVLTDKETYREFLRCGYKVGLSYSDPWHDGKLEFFRNHTLGGDLSILLSGFGVKDAVQDYPQLDIHDREKLADFIEEMKRSFGISRTKVGRTGWLYRIFPKRK